MHELGKEYFIPGEGWCIVSKVSDAQLSLLRISDKPVEITVNREGISKEVTSDSAPKRIPNLRMCDLGHTIFYYMPLSDNSVIRWGTFVFTGPYQTMIVDGKTGEAVSTQAVFTYEMLLQANTNT